MSPIRRRIVCSLVLLLVAGHLVCVGLRREWWPLSHYPMYAKPLPIPMEFQEVRGISAEDPDKEVELPVLGGPRFVRVGWGINALISQVNQGGRPPETLEGALAQVAVLYNYQRERGNSDLEPLSGIRVYRQTWVIDEQAGKRVWKLVQRKKVAEGYINHPL